MCPRAEFPRAQGQVLRQNLPSPIEKVAFVSLGAPKNIVDMREHARAAWRRMDLPYADAADADAIVTTLRLPGGVEGQNRQEIRMRFG